MKAPRRPTSGNQKPPEFRWLKALRVCAELKNQPGCLRLGMALFDLYNSADGFAFPSRSYLAQDLGSHEANISDWTSRLRDVGAIQTVVQAKLPPEARKSSDPRSLAYFLKFGWADRVLALHGESDGLSGKRPPARSVVRPTTDKVAISTTDLGSETHYPYNLSGQPTDNREKICTDGSELGVYGKGKTPLEIAYDPTSDDAEGIHWLRYQGLTESEVRTALPLLMAHKLYPSTLDHMKARRKAHGRAA